MEQFGAPFEIDANAEAQQIFGEIKTELMLLFGIEEREAIGRIDRFWHGRSFTDEGVLNQLDHDHRDDYWAKTIWYGRESFWWVKDERTLTPTSWP